MYPWPRPRKPGRHSAYRTRRARPYAAAPRGRTALGVRLFRPGPRVREGCCVWGRTGGRGHRAAPRPPPAPGGRRPSDAAQGVPRPLVVPAGRTGAVQLRRAAGDRGVADAVLPAEHVRGRLPGLVRTAARRPDARSPGACASPSSPGPAGLLAHPRVCLALQWHDRTRLEQDRGTGDVAQSVEGGCRESHAPVPARERHAVVARQVPRPLPTPPAGSPAGRLSRWRGALSGWFHSDRVALPGEDADGGERRDDGERRDHRDPAGTGGHGRSL